MGRRLESLQAARWAVIFLVDGVATAVALPTALWVRFDGNVPAHYAAMLPRAVLLLVGVRLACNWAIRLHRWSFRFSGLHEALRTTAAGIAGSVLFATAAVVLVPGGIPRSVIVLEFFAATTAFGAVRFGPRAAFRWLELLRRRGDGARALIVGESNAAELLARDLQRNADRSYRLVGLVSDRRSRRGHRLDGVPIVGAVFELPDLVRRHRVTTVFLADDVHDGARVRGIVNTCAALKVRFMIVPASLHRSRRLSVAALDELSPEDLLSRSSVAFDEEAIRALVQGRTALVTGAGGSIGSELSRQLLRFGVRQLVMVDMNENELYLRGRQYAAEFPGADVHLEVADIREAEALRHVGERYHPQDVFHAAAHKHVPLMEDAPEEAVKNNVFGTLNAVHMAHACGAERFVLISTDKAVKPTSVMGATKRVAELIARDVGRVSRTRMTAVRFGNVLGSAGSVLPLFKEQIARGGPVTVTDPECTRYFMTVAEAAGLTLLAGLGGYGDLCVLDMGEPVRIADLAMSMVALAGRAGEIPIVFTGLRAGEKLHEEVLTEEEERSQVVRNGIRVTHSPPPPTDLETWLAQLRRLADTGDRSGILSVLHALVPTYQITRNVADAKALAAATTNELPGSIPVEGERGRAAVEGVRQVNGAVGAHPAAAMMELHDIR
jgi:FlaA1/EpsC-like NDP-sugar epimerase